MLKRYKFGGVALAHNEAGAYISQNLTVIVEAADMQEGRRKAYRLASALYSDISISTGQQVDKDAELGVKLTPRTV